jgi:hypothetical protein
VIVIGGPDGTKNRKVIDDAAEVRPPVRYLDAALPLLAIPDLQGQHRSHELAVHAGELHHVLFDEGRIENTAMRRSPMVLPANSVQLRLGVERLEVTDAALQENPDDAFRFRRKMCFPSGGPWPRFGSHHRFENQARKAHPRSLEPLAAIHWFHRILTNSSLLNNT